jgi:multiple sugar transport system permease protein
MDSSVISPTSESAEDTRVKRRSGLFSGRRGRHLREYITAYLMIAPATTLIFVFGIFPVAFALYVSLHRWRLVRSDFIGLTNYVNAVENLIYAAIFILGVGALAGCYVFLRRVIRTANEARERPWLLAIPGALYAAATLAFFRWAYLQLPEVLDIADKLRGLERTRELLMNLLGEAFRAETVYPAWRLFVIIALAAIVVSWLAGRIVRSRFNIKNQLNLYLAWLSAAVGFGLLRVNFQAIADVYDQAVETGEDPGIWPQLIMIASGAILLALGWRIWNSMGDSDSNRGFALRGLAALALLVGAVLLILEIPTIVASGDADMWQGLKVTVFYSIGTVPFQLMFALFLAVLLYRHARGSEIFRMIFFLPYVTPVVASAAVFKGMFSNRPQAPVNSLVRFLGLEPQLWLREPNGVFNLLAERAGIDIPGWAAGPSLALVAIMIFSIWTFVGYNVVIYLAGLVNISKELTEAAEIDGANRWQIFRHITFPLLSPTTYFLSLVGIIGTFKAFRHIWVMRDGAALGTTDPFSVVIFAEFFEKTRYGYAAALAFVLFAIILSLTYINNRVQGSRVFYG